MEKFKFTFSIIVVIIFLLFDQNHTKALGKTFPSKRSQERVVNELIRRTLGDDGTAFEVSIDNKLDFRSFELRTTIDKILINAYDGISAAKGFHHYLKNYLNKSIYWYNDPVKVSPIMIFPNITYRSKCESSIIYYQNVCTWGYSFVWWKWSTWVKHIDWMAMMGISLTIAPVQEHFWHETYSELGLTEEEIDSHISGPAFLPWFRMGNIRGWAGPASPTLRKMQMILQKKIIEKQRLFGMEVAVPAFSGYVPIAMKRLYPNVSFVVADPWNKFPDKYCCSLFVNPIEILFAKIAGMFLRKVIKNYGTDHIYFTDPFNEMQPQSSDPAYLNATSYFIYDSMQNVDNEAIWLLQGWMFVKNIFWSSQQIEAFLTAVPIGRMLVLDLQSEQYPQFERTHSFYGQPFIWCMLHNFGGTLGMHGSSEVINNGIRQARQMPNSSLVGVGITPEGINQNYVMYSLVLERAWLKDDINLSEWFSMYSDVRYGVINKQLRDAWQLLRESVYSYHGLRKIRGKYILARRPSTHLSVWTWYNASSVYDAWAKFLSCNGSIPHNYYKEYKHDLVDITRQFLQIMSELLYVNIMNAFRDKDVDRFNRLANQMLHMFSDLEEILATDKHFLLGNWLEQAKKWSSNADEKELYEFNARNQITLWGPTGQIVDYATKQWSGIVKDFFLPRWTLFLEYLSKCLYTNQPFNNSRFSQDVFEKIENPFNYQRVKYPTKERGNTYNSSMRIFLNWFTYLSNETNHKLFRTGIKMYTFERTREQT